MKQKNMPIEAMRFIFICMICSSHCPAVSTFLPHGNIGVEFFFILSGFFIYYSYIHHPDTGVFAFSWKKVKRFFWPLVISNIALMLLDRKQYIYPHELSPDGILTQYFSQIPDFMFAQGFYLHSHPGMINAPVWFIMVLIIGGGILYALLRYYKSKATSLFVPIIVVIGTTYLLSFGDAGLKARPGGIPGLDCNIIRGISEMGLGVLLACFYEQKKGGILAHSRIMSFCGIIAFIGMLLIALANNDYDWLSLFLIPFVLLSCVDGKSVFSKLFFSRIWGWLGGISLYMFFVQMLVSAIYYIIATRSAFVTNLPVAVSFTAYLVACVVAGYVLKILSDKMAKATRM